MVRHGICVTMLLGFSILTGCKMPQQRAHFYVSPQGSDQFSGRYAEVSRQDGPFKTLQRAQEAVHELKKTSNQDIVVMLRQGDYYLDQTLVFGLQDSGKDGQHIIYRNYPNETPVITTGTRITGWRKCDNLPAEISEKAKGNIWVADVPEEVGTFYVLFDDGTWLPRARSGPLFTANQVKFADTIDVEKFADRSKVYYPKGAVTEADRIRDIELIVIPSNPWSMSILPIASLDEENGLALTSVPATYAPGLNLHFKEGPNLWVENDFQYLDEPGEWVFDSLRKKVYLWPKTDKPSEFIYAPTVTELIKVEGDIRYDESVDDPVKNLVFEGLTFSRANRYSWKKDWQGRGLQHNWDMFDEPSAMLRFRGAEGCKVLNCVFTNSGAGGIRLDLYAQKNEVSGCQFTHLGGGGVLLAGYGPGTKDVNKSNKIINNEIYDIGKLYWHSLGIWAWQSGENTIANNLIHHTPYAGIAVTGRIYFDEKGQHECSKTVRWHEVEEADIHGDAADYAAWKLQEKYLHARYNLVTRNELYKVCDVLGDGNAIYVSGCGRGNIVSENSVHDMTHLWATSVLRIDDWTFENTYEKNLVYDCAIPAMIMKHENNKYNNNIFVKCGSPREVVSRRYAYIAMRYGPVTGSQVKYNIIYNDNPVIDAYEYGKTYGQPSHLNQCEADYNVYYCPADPNWEKENLSAHQAMGIEQHSLVTDPMFVDVHSKDFRLKKESPVLRFPGYQQIPLDKIGLLRD